MYRSFVDRAFTNRNRDWLHLDQMIAPVVFAPVLHGTCPVPSYWLQSLSCFAKALGVSQTDGGCQYQALQIVIVLLNVIEHKRIREGNRRVTADYGDGA